VQKVASDIRVNELKQEILRLLKEDEEFRYAIAGLIGLNDNHKKIEKHERGVKEV